MRGEHEEQLTQVRAAHEDAARTREARAAASAAAAAATAAASKASAAAAAHAAVESRLQRELNDQRKKVQRLQA